MPFTPPCDAVDVRDGPSPSVPPTPPPMPIERLWAALSNGAPASASCSASACDEELQSLQTETPVDTADWPRRPQRIAPPPPPPASILPHYSDKFALSFLTAAVIFVIAQMLYRDLFLPRGDCDEVCQAAPLKMCPPAAPRPGSTFFSLTRPPQLNIAKHLHCMRDDGETSFAKFLASSGAEREHSVTIREDRERKWREEHEHDGHDDEHDSEHAHADEHSDDDDEHGKQEGHGDAHGERRGASESSAMPMARRSRA